MGQVRSEKDGQPFHLSRRFRVTNARPSPISPFPTHPWRDSKANAETFQHNELPPACSDHKYAEYAWGPCLHYRYVRPRIRFPATSSSPARAAALFTPRATLVTSSNPSRELCFVEFLRRAFLHVPLSLSPKLRPFFDRESINRTFRE